MRSLFAWGRSRSKAGPPKAEPSEIVVTVYRPASAAAAEDTFQVELARAGATVGRLKGRLCELYGLAPDVLELRRDADGPTLASESPLECADGDVLYLVPPAPVSVGAMIAEAAGAVAGLLEEAREAQDPSRTVELTFVMPASPPKDPKERRCQLELSQLARTAEVLEVLRLELGFPEDEPLALEYAGTPLPAEATLRIAGLGSGDVVMVVRLKVENARAT